ncbi:MAG: YeeE/YedE thiosulfate transporter family protein, partial [Gammaproteobacteria bacterium]
MFKNKMPYVWGVFMGLVVVFAFATARPVGTATVYEKVTGHILQFFSPEYVRATEHYFASAKPVAEWETMFVIGLFLAGLIARYLLGGRAQHNYIPQMWEQRFGASRVRRYTTSFVGGVLLLIGARLANGCTSGHFISGGSELALSEYIFVIAMFAS